MGPAGRPPVVDVALRSEAAAVPEVSSRAKVIALCRAAGLEDPDFLADELNLMLEGARVTAQSVGRDGLGAQLRRMSEALIAAHAPK